jgi:hypothetical protein
VLNVTVVNASNDPIVLTGFDLRVLDYRPYASAPESHVLSPVALVDVTLPFGTGTFSHNLSSPIMVAAKDAATVSYRFHTEYRGKIISPAKTARYTIRLVLRGDVGLVGSTEVFTF